MMAESTDLAPVVSLAAVEIVAPVVRLHLVLLVATTVGALVTLPLLVAMIVGALVAAGLMILASLVIGLGHRGRAGDE